MSYDNIMEKHALAPILSKSIKIPGKLFHLRNFIIVCTVLGLGILTVIGIWYFSRREYNQSWPMFRYDARRSADSPEALPAQLNLQWTRQLPQPQPAWTQIQYKLQFDRSYEPVVMDDLIFIPSMVNDSVTAYDIDSGKEKWRFYTDGPVRFAPVAWQGKLFFVSDDGYLYCLKAKKGKLLWKFRGAPADRMILGNERLISSWPARGAPVIYDGKIYFTAGIWPFMGIFIHCLDAETGQVVWTNSGSGSTYITQQHNSPAFATVAPQGYLAAIQDKLLIPGRTVPACYRRQTGELLYYHLSDRAFGKYVGGYKVSAWRDWFFNNEIIYRLDNGKGLARTQADVLADKAVYSLDQNGQLIAYTLQPDKKDAQGLLKCSLEIPLDKIHLKAGPRLYASGPDGLIAALEIPDANTSHRLSWSCHIDGQVWNMIAAYGKLFVTTLSGKLYCFGAEKVQPINYMPEKAPLKQTASSFQQKIQHILQLADQPDGYCLLLGLGKGNLLRELIRQSDLHIIALDTDRKKVAKMRRELTAAGFYGERVAIHLGDIFSRQLPPYFADLIVSEDLTEAGYKKRSMFVKYVFHSLRPFGSAACLQASKQEKLLLFQQVNDASLAGHKVSTDKEIFILKRVGALPGSADWTHQYGDAANSLCSQDKLVKAPLGLLWFGDRCDFTDVLPRHGHGPPEQVIGGRLFIEGIKTISARDVYTGRTLWKRHLKNLDTFGVYYDDSLIPDPLDKTYNQEHLPGANARGTNFVATQDSIYIIEKGRCRVLDAVTGHDRDIFSLPGIEPNDSQWGFISVYEDYLIAGADFAQLSHYITPTGKPKKDRWLRYYDRLAGKRLLALNRHTGKVLWQFQAQNGFIHNAIAIGNDKIYCLDKLPPMIENAQVPDIQAARKTFRLLALDIKSGRILWENNETAFGTWLSYSHKYDILLQAYRPSRDMLPEPDNRMAAFLAEDGTLIWDRPNQYTGPCILHDDTVITQGRAFSLLSGSQKKRKNPITGELVPWEFTRNYGCDFVIGSQNLLTFRSAVAGFYDLAHDSGTGNLGGFKSGCTSNLLAADGVLNAPDYTHTCTCSYQNQTSLALVHMPEAEIWTFNKISSRPNAPLLQLGINFGAPGDRRAENGTLWLDYPVVGGISPDVSITTVPEKLQCFRKHASAVRGSVPHWITASGARGLREISIKLNNSQERLYTIRLYFLEPDNKSTDQRIFDVALQDETVLKDFDIVAEAGKPDLDLIKEFTSIPAAATLNIVLTPSQNSLLPETILCGLEIIAEN